MTRGVGHVARTERIAPAGGPSAADWSLLAPTDARRRDHTTDSHFRCGWRDLADTAGDDRREVLRTTTALILKPEALSCHRAVQILERVTRLGFQPLFLCEIAFSDAPVHAAWARAMTGASEDWIRLRTSFPAHAPALYVGLRHPAPAGRTAAEALSAAKGSAHPARQVGGELRAGLGAPNAVISFLHAPDDPADFLRELSIWLGRPDRLALLRAALSPVDRPAEGYLDQVRRLQARGPRRRPEPEAARREILREVTRRRDLDPALADDLLALLGDGGKEDMIPRLERGLRALGADPYDWSVFVYCSEHVPLYAPPAAREPSV